MKITMYELLGMVKDGKAPNKIIAGDSEEVFELSLKELQAINKQVEELNWNER